MPSHLGQTYISFKWEIGKFDNSSTELIVTDQHKIKVLVSPGSRVMQIKNQINGWKTYRKGVVLHVDKNCKDKCV